MPGFDAGIGTMTGQFRSVNAGFVGPLTCPVTRDAATPPLRAPRTSEECGWSGAPATPNPQGSLRILRQKDRRRPSRCADPSKEPAAVASLEKGPLWWRDQPAPNRGAGPIVAQNALRHSGFDGYIVFVNRGVDKERSRSLYTPNTARRRSAGRRASEAPHRYSVTRSDLGRGHGVSTPLRASGEWDPDWGPGLFDK